VKSKTQPNATASWVTVQAGLVLQIHDPLFAVSKVKKSSRGKGVPGESIENIDWLPVGSIFHEISGFLEIASDGFRWLQIHSKSVFKASGSFRDPSRLIS